MAEPGTRGQDDRKGVGPGLGSRRNTSPEPATGAQESHRGREVPQPAGPHEPRAELSSQLAPGPRFLLSVLPQALNPGAPTAASLSSPQLSIHLSAPVLLPGPPPTHTPSPVHLRSCSSCRGPCTPSPGGQAQVLPGSGA